MDPSKATEIPNEPGEFQGLMFVDAGQRAETADRLVPEVAASLRHCLDAIASSWERGGGWPDSDGEALRWSVQLRSLAGTLVAEFSDALRADFTEARYPPDYGFSGVSVSESDSDLVILDEYDTGRRETRYELERALKELDPFTYSALQAASLQPGRFRYPNWAPWTPLHWYERLIEAAERRWGRDPATLQLMRGYKRCLEQSGQPLLRATLALLQAHGLAESAESESESDPRAPADMESPEADPDELWHGLEELAPAQRRALAEELVPEITEHLERCIDRTRGHWASGNARSDNLDEDPAAWATRLEDRRDEIAGLFREALERDIQEAHYPPRYAFSGAGFAAKSGELSFLGDYQSGRRTLRHELEGRLRGSHRQAYRDLRRAALHEQRFRHPNWAPWSPLHWYERLIEAAETAFGQCSQTLELMRAYVGCIDSDGTVLIVHTLQTVEGLGLLEGAADEPYEPERPSVDRPVKRGISWSELVEEAAEPGGATKDRVGTAQRAPVQQAPVRLVMPTDPGDVEEWGRWMLRMSARLCGEEAGELDGTVLEHHPWSTGLPRGGSALAGRGSGHGTYSVAGPGPGPGIGAGSGTGTGPGAGTGTGASIGTDTGAGAGIGTDTGSGAGAGPGVAAGAGLGTGTGSFAGDAPTSAQAGPDIAADGTAAVQPARAVATVVSAEDRLVPVARDLLRGLLDRIFEQVEMHPDVLAELDHALTPLGDAVAHDRGFLMERSHPLRCWLGAFINSGFHLDPARGSVDGGIPGQLLACLRGSVSQLTVGTSEEQAHPDRHKQLLEPMQECLKGVESEWQVQRDSLLPPLAEQERRARATRSLTASAVAADALLPGNAARGIIDAWTKTLAVEECLETRRISTELRQIVDAICIRSAPAAIAPQVRSLLSTAKELDVDDDTMKFVISQLAAAHRETLKGPLGRDAFNPRARLRDHTQIRAEDDDPELVADRADSHVLEASRLRVGDWFELLSRTSGRPQRLRLAWHGEASRQYLFLGLDVRSIRQHSLQGIAHEMRMERLRRLPQDNPLDAILR